jgi:hypothetical protein
MTSWRTPYAGLWRIAEAGTVDDLVELWRELDGPALLKALKRRTWKYRQSSHASPWHGQPQQKPTVRNPELVAALDKLGDRVRENPAIWADHRAIATGAGHAILDMIAEIRVWAEKQP